VQVGHVRYLCLCLWGSIEDKQQMWFDFISRYDFLSIHILIYCNSILECVASLYKQDVLLNH
jgi:hypothetical protein